MIRHLFLLACFATPLHAGVDEAVNDHLLPSLSGFTETAETLDDLAQVNCTAEALQAPYNAAFDAWMRIADIRLGPSEHGALSIYFWPDKKGFTPKALNQLIAAESPIVDDPSAFTEVSIAGRGFFALERMLYDPEFNGYGEDDYACRLTRALTHDLARQARDLETAWREDFVPLLLSPGAENNTTYLDESEAQRAIYTQILASLELTADTRLGRPLDQPTRPLPARAEAWRSERSLTNSLIATASAVELAEALADWELPLTREALERVYVAADSIGDPGFQDIENLMNRLKVEILAQEIDTVENTIESEVGTRFGITPGFNSSDGD